MAKSEKVILPPHLYEMLERAGWDMSPYVVWQLLHEKVLQWETK